MTAFFTVIFFLAFFRRKLAGTSCTGHLSEHGFALVDHVYNSLSTDHLFACFIACNMQPTCQSFNYDLAEKTCQLNNNTKYFRPEYFVEKGSSVYADNPDSEAPWQKMNTVPVCFGAKDNQFGSFEVKIGGSVNSMKLVHVSGEVGCAFWSGLSKFGCQKSSPELYTFITTANNDILLPEIDEFLSRYVLQGYHPDSTEIVFTNISTPLRLSSGQQLRIWYGEDLTDVDEFDNGGLSCVDVYAKYA